MNTEKNIAVVKKFIEQVINKQEFEAIETLWAKDMRWYGGIMGEIHGVEAYKKFLMASANGAFSGMQLDIIDIVAQDDKVVVFFTNSGKNVGEFLGNKATDKHAKWDGMGLYHLKDGKIVDASFTEDLLNMFVQLGFIKM